MSKSEIRRLDISDPIATEAGKALFEEMNISHGSYIWGPVRRGIIAIEAEMREKIAQEIESLQNPPPIDEIETIVWNVVEHCAEIARGNHGNQD